MRILVRAGGPLISANISATKSGPGVETVLCLVKVVIVGWETLTTRHVEPIWSDPGIYLFAKSGMHAGNPPSPCTCIM